MSSYYDATAQAVTRTVNTGFDTAKGAAAQAAEVVTSTATQVGLKALDVATGPDTLGFLGENADVVIVGTTSLITDATYTGIDYVAAAAKNGAAGTAKVVEETAKKATRSFLERAAIAVRNKLGAGNASDSQNKVEPQANTVKEHEEKKAAEQPLDLEPEMVKVNDQPEEKLQLTNDRFIMLFQCLALDAYVAQKGAANAALKAKNDAAILRYPAPLDI